MKDILSFEGKYSWLSNFAPVAITFDGCAYPSVEHAYQAAKTLISSERMSIAQAPTAGAAKRLGRDITLRPDWNDVKLHTMYLLTLKKYTIEKYWKRLKATGTARIIESNNWGDTYWGVCDGIGDNLLGQTIMAVRDEYLAIARYPDDEEEIELETITYEVSPADPSLK